MTGDEGARGNAVAKSVWQRTLSVLETNDGGERPYEAV